MTPITNNMDVFAEKFEGIDLHGKKITKTEFDDYTFVSCDFSETFLIFVLRVHNALNNLRSW